MRRTAGAASRHGWSPRSPQTHSPAHGLHRLEAGTLVDNLASQQVLLKNGFERIGLSHRHLQIAGHWRDHVLFARTHDEPWPAD